MPKNQYKGKRIQVTLSQADYDRLIAFAKVQVRPVAQSASALIVWGLNSQEQQTLIR